MLTLNSPCLVPENFKICPASFLSECKTLICLKTNSYFALFELLLTLSPSLAVKCECVNVNPNIIITPENPQQCNSHFSTPVCELNTCLSLPLFPHSRPPKKDFVEVTELTDITYTSNLVKLMPGHINVVLVLTNASKNALLRKFAKEVFSFSGQVSLQFASFIVESFV